MFAAPLARFARALLPHRPAATLRSYVRRPDPYELAAIDEIKAWKHPEPTFFGDVSAVLSAPTDLLGDILFNNPVGGLVGKAFEGIVGLLNDGAAGTVSPQRILRRFHKEGYGVVTLTDLRSFPLEDLDHMSAHLRSRYMAMAAAEGMATGALGGPALAADVVALLALNLRAINETATFYGFDIRDPDEQHFATQVLLLASSPDAAAKTQTLAQLHRIAAAAAKRKTWKQLRGMALVPMFEETAKVLGMRLTKAKLGQSIPIVGAAFGGGYNAHFTAQATLAARHLYRERHLDRYFGRSVVPAPVG